MSNELLPFEHGFEQGLRIYLHRLRVFFTSMAINLIIVFLMALTLAKSLSLEMRLWLSFAVVVLSVSAYLANLGSRKRLSHDAS